MAHALIQPNRLPRADLPPCVLSDFASVALVTESNQPPQATAPETDERTAWAFGLATFAGTDGEGGVLDTWFPAPELGEPADDVEALIQAAADETERLVEQIASGEAAEA